MRSIVLVALVTVAIALVPVVSPPRAHADESVPAQRAQGVGGQQPGIAYERTKWLENDLAAMQSAGMTWVRADFFWYAIQPTGPNSWNWGPTDAFVKAARAHHLQVLGMLGFSPKWARSGSSAYYPPKNVDDFSAFARAAAKRYAPMGVHAWEIWNEPNLSMFWSPKADPAAYTKLLRGAYSAIKGADRNATVVTGGLAPSNDKGQNLSPIAFLASIYLHGAKNDFDAVGEHPYSYPYAPMYKAPWNVFYTTPDLHQLMVAVGDGNKQIWGTEIGYPTGTGPKAVSDQQQANELVAAISAWRKWSFVGPLFIYEIRDASSNPSNPVDNMGIRQWDGKPKPAYNAIRRKLR